MDMPEIVIIIVLLLIVLGLAMLLSQKASSATKEGQDKVVKLIEHDSISASGTLDSITCSVNPITLTSRFSNVNFDYKGDEPLSIMAIADVGGKLAVGKKDNGAEIISYPAERNVALTFANRVPAQETLEAYVHVMFWQSGKCIRDYMNMKEADRDFSGLVGSCPEYYLTSMSAGTTVSGCTTEQMCEEYEGIPNCDPIDVGGCRVTICPKAWDESDISEDGGAGKYYDTDNGDGYRTVMFSDNPAKCDNNMEFTTEWKIYGTELRVETSIIHLDASGIWWGSNQLGAGFTLSSDCKYSRVSVEDYTPTSEAMPYQSCSSADCSCTASSDEFGFRPASAGGQGVSNNDKIIWVFNIGGC